MSGKYLNEEDLDDEGDHILGRIQNYKVLSCVLNNIAVQVLQVSSTYIHKYGSFRPYSLAEVVPEKAAELMDDAVTLSVSGDINIWTIGTCIQAITCIYRTDVNKMLSKQSTKCCPQTEVRVQRHNIPTRKIS